MTDETVMDNSQEMAANATPEDAEASPPPAEPQGDAARQAEMPFAMVQGAPVTELPTDLYIPPDALEVILEAFEGPLDLLLYLIRRQNLDIIDIPIAAITEQYMEYVELMREFRLELAAEYLVMAAILAEIKSRMLLPRPSASEEDDELDPRADLIRRLQEYERFKQAAEDIESLPRMGRDFYPTSAHVEDKSTIAVPPDVDLKELMLALKDVMGRAELFTHHHVQREPLSVRERMSSVLEQLRTKPYSDFYDLFDPEEGRIGVVVTFLSLLELLKEHLIELIQNEAFGPIHIKAIEQDVTEEEALA